MSPLEEFMKAQAAKRSTAPMIVSFVQCNESSLSEVDIIPGQWVFCADTKDYYVDTNDSVRTKISDTIFVASEDVRTGLLAPLENKLYIEQDTGRAFLYDGTKWDSLSVSASSVYTADGSTVEDKLAGISKIGRRTARVTATSNGQTVFTVPFPFANYLAAGNFVEVLIDSKIVDETLYTISGTTLTLDNSLALDSGEVLRFIFWYNDYTDSTYNPQSVTLPAQNIVLANGMTLQAAVMQLMEEVSTHKSLAQNVIDLTIPEESND